MIRAFHWNEDSNVLAYLRFDESEVPEFSMDIYGSTLYPKRQVFKYPKAGENNSKITLKLYDLVEKSTAVVNLSKFEPHYIPRIKWTQNPHVLSVLTLNRHQNSLNLLTVDARENTVSLLLNEKDEAYLDVHDNLEFLEDNSFVWTSEKDGRNHLYHYDQKGQLKNQITSGSWEVTKYTGLIRNPKKSSISPQKTVPSTRAFTRSRSPEKERRSSAL